MNVVGVADTHTALWYLAGDARLSFVAKSFIDRATRDGNKVGVSTISLAEIVFLVEKKRIPPRAYDEMKDVLSDPEHVFVAIVLSGAVTDAMRQVARAEVPDMPDRIVAATAVHLDVAVISRDAQIRSSAIRTIW